MIKPEEAALLISKWKEEHTLLSFIGKLAVVTVLDGYITEFDGEVIQIESDDGSATATFRLSNAAAFDYGESKEFQRVGMMVALSHAPERRSEKIFLIPKS
jgi:hypothetical protein